MNAEFNIKKRDILVDLNRIINFAKSDVCYKIEKDEELAYNSDLATLIRMKYFVEAAKYRNIKTISFSENETLIFYLYLKRLIDEN